MGIHYQMILLWDVWFPFLRFESIQSHSPSPYTPYNIPTTVFMGLFPGQYAVQYTSPKFSATSNVGWWHGR